MSFQYRPTCEVLAEMEAAESRDRMEMLVTGILVSGAFALGLLVMYWWMA